MDMSRLDFLTSPNQISVFAMLAFLLPQAELGRSPLPGHGHFLCLLKKTKKALFYMNIDNWSELLSLESVDNLIFILPAHLICVPDLSERIF